MRIGLCKCCACIISGNLTQHDLITERRRAMERDDVEAARTAFEDAAQQRSSGDRSQPSSSFV
jgi:hypothetical protein